VSGDQSGQQPGGSRRAEVLALLASYGGRGVAAVPEGIDSLELAWLVHQVEQRYGRELDLNDALLARMGTVDGAAEVLSEFLMERADG
jgi:hypothetical protein